MIIKWFGYSYFRIDTQNKTLALNPYNESDTGLRPARFKSDIIFVSNPENNIQTKKDIPNKPFLLAGAGEVERGNIFIKGIVSSYNAEKKESSGLNIIYIIDSEDITIVHLGNLRKKKLRDSVLEKVSRADILLLPVGGHNALDAEEALFLTNQIEPKIVIPMNYDIPGGKIKLDKIDKFIKTFEKKPEMLSKLVVKKNQLPSETKLIILEKS